MRAAGNSAVAQCMCAVVVDVAGLVAQQPPAAAAGAAPPGPDAAAEPLPPYLAALRHNDCHYVYQVSHL